MTPGRPRNHPFAPPGALAALAVVLGAAVTTGRGQPPAGAQALNREFISAVTCAQCHEQAPRVRPDVPGAPPLLLRLVLRDEYKTWNESDRHRRAFDALKGGRGKAMGTLLGLDDVAGERACLSCHATGFERDDPPAGQEPALLSRELGVGCTSCHGPYREWVQNHFFGINPDPRWRGLPPEEKSRKYGMTDLRDPATRAGVCYSCHVGKAEQGKVVTHAMYAAGHPPLPGVEVATFLESMPPHWSPAREVEAFQKDAALRAKNHVDFSEPQATKSVVVGGVVALRDAMRLLAARSEPEPEPLGRWGLVWPDYAQLECAACHHDLKTPGAGRSRQARQSRHWFDGQVVAGVAGRPQFRPWPLALSGLALAQTGGADRAAYREGVKDLYAAFDARPFGDPAAVFRAARRLEAWSESALGSIRGTRFDASTPPKLLAALASVADDEVVDYDSARQVARAFKAIYADWQPGPANADGFAAVLGDLDRALKLNPDASRGQRAAIVSAAVLTGDPLRDALSRLTEQEVKGTTALAADFDPEAFHKLMRKLYDLLAASEGRPR